MVGLGFKPWVGHLGTWGFSWGRSQRNCTLANPKVNPGTPLPISQRWLEGVDDELSALAVKTLSLSPRVTRSKMGEKTAFRFSLSPAFLSFLGGKFPPFLYGKIQKKEQKTFLFLFLWVSQFPRRKVFSFSSTFTRRDNLGYRFHSIGRSKITPGLRLQSSLTAGIQMINTK